MWVQVVDYAFFSKQALKQQQRSIEVAPVRGYIYDRNGNQLAGSMAVESVFAAAAEIPDIHSTAGILRRVLKADATEIENRLRAWRDCACVARMLRNEAS